MKLPLFSPRIHFPSWNCTKHIKTSVQLAFHHLSAIFDFSTYISSNLQYYMIQEKTYSQGWSCASRFSSVNWCISIWTNGRLTIGWVSSHHWTRDQGLSKIKWCFFIAINCNQLFDWKAFSVKINWLQNLQLIEIIDYLFVTTDLGNYYRPIRVRLCCLGQADAMLCGIVCSAAYAYTVCSFVVCKQSTTSCCAFRYDSEISVLAILQRG